MNQSGSGEPAVISSAGIMNFTLPEKRKTSASSAWTIHSAYLNDGLLSGCE
jgi:hypothetical protein